MTSTRVRLGVVALGAALLGAILSAVPAVLELEEEAGLAWLFTVRGPIEPPAEVVVVNIDRDSAEALGTSTDLDEWPRALHAMLIDELSEAGAAAIAFDIIFEAEREDADDDRQLAEAIARAGNVILLERVRSEEHPILAVEHRGLPIAPFRRGALATAPFTLPRYPVRVNQFWTFGRAVGDTPSLPSAVLHAYALPVHERLLGLIAEARPGLEPALEQIGREPLQGAMRRLRGLFNADPELGLHVSRALRDLSVSAHEEQLLSVLVTLYSGPASRHLNFYGPARTVETVPYHEVLDSASGEWRDLVRGRAIFVGFSERRQSEQQDEFHTVYSLPTGQNLHGVEIGATAFANLMTMRSVVPLSLTAHWLIVAAWGVAIAALSVLPRGFAPLAAVAGAAAVYAGAAQYLFEARELWLPLVVPLGVQLPAALLAGMSWNYVVLRRQREQIHAALDYYLPAPVVARLVDETTRPRSRREVVFGTCLVTDAEQYTTLSEALHPAELGELMDAYYDVLVEAVHRHGGVVSDIGGDSMVAVWPAAGAAEERARLCASRAAVDVLRAVDEFNRARVGRELPTRLGIDSGQLLLGNVGATRRGEYRAVGDIVNTASRLQGLNRLLGTRVLLSASAVANAPELTFRPLGRFLLVGKQKPVLVCELQAPELTEAGGGAELNRAFADALEVFQRGDWQRARAAFSGIGERFPADAASRFFAAQCNQLAAWYPEGDWDGVVRVSVK